MCRIVSVDHIQHVTARDRRSMCECGEMMPAANMRRATFMALMRHSRRGFANRSSDISADANPITGVWVACGLGCGMPPGSWLTVGGTSVSSPLVAAMTNGAGRFAPNTASELRTIYANSEYPRFGPWRRFNNVVHGICGPFAGYATNNMNGWVPPSWDFCTGVGSPKGHAGLRLERAARSE
jgi:hypothetical protein